jgi:ABC-type phosphate transport system auxiliary subunit
VSDKEQYEVIGRVCVQCKETTQKIAAIESELKRLNDALRIASNRLDQLLAKFDREAVIDFDASVDFKNIPASEAVQKLLYEARTQAQTLRDLGHQKRKFRF